MERKAYYHVANTFLAIIQFEKSMTSSPFNHFSHGGSSGDADAILNIISARGGVISNSSA